MMQLNEKYNRNQFIEFLNFFIPDFIKDIRKVDVSNFKTLQSGKYLGKNEKFDLQVFELEHKVSPGSKVALASDGFRVMRDSSSFQSLVSYYNPGVDEWRLSLMMATPKINEEGKVVTILSNPRRYSYALGSRAKVNTPYNFLIKKGKVKSYDELKERFSVEVVNKEFYREIAKLYTELVGGIRENGKNKIEYPGLIKLPLTLRDDTLNHEFAVRLIGRVIFCWFLREKKSDKGIPLISEEILSLRAIKENPNYYHNILEPLFFEILNKPMKERKDKYTEGLYSLIPYLNGGLFTPNIDDFYNANGPEKTNKVSEAIVPDKWLLSLFEVLEQYNFTIDENTTMDVDLSIDPEMLGRIFENLLAEINPEIGETVRKSTGSFYTPREIVDYMIDDSLFYYFKSKIDIDEKKLRSLITYDLNDDLENPIEDSYKVKLIKMINDLKLLDSACGSGAFPIGTLQKILYVLQILDPEGKLWFEEQISDVPPEVKRLIEKEFNNKNLNYVRKLGIIRNSIFGIDIQSIATEISRLRCFLTLIVDELVNDQEDNRGIEPLPNLDFKFVTANTLIGLSSLNKGKQQIGLFEDIDGINNLKELRDMFFSASGNEREQIKLKFIYVQNKMFQKLIQDGNKDHADLTTQLTTWEPFSNKPSSWFDSEWMFGVKNGFDIVIGNPPYDVYEGHKAGEIETLRKISIYEKAFGGKLNAYKLFLAKSSELLRENGILCKIFQNSFIADKSAKLLRKYFIENQQIIRIDSFPERDNIQKRMFEGVKMSVCILLSRKKNISNKQFILNIWSDRYMSSKKSSILSMMDLLIFDSESYTIPMVAQNELELLRKVSGNPRLEKIALCFQGEINMTKHKYLFRKESKNNAELLKGAGIQRWYLTKNMSQGEIEYLDWRKYQKDNHGSKSKHHNEERIVTQGITGVNEKIRIKCTIINKGIYCAHSVNYIILKNQEIDKKYLLALLNSKLLNWYFSIFSTNSNVNSYEISRLPILISNNQEEYINIVKKIFDLMKYRKSQEEIKITLKVLGYERLIDRLIYKLFDLTQEEIEIVEKYYSN